MKTLNQLQNGNPKTQLITFAVLMAIATLACIVFHIQIQ